MPQTLLLADDSLTIQRVIELTFADEDINVVAVGDGDQAIARIDESAPDIVLADVGMPGRNGYEVAQHIKRSPGLSHIPVLLLTGAFEPVDQTKVADAGCDGVLAKPFEPHLVIARVKELLERAAAEPRQPAPTAAAPEAESQELPSVSSSDAEPPKSGQAERLDSYFAQLDAAFATLSPAASEAPEPPERSVSEALQWLESIQSVPEETPEVSEPAQVSEDAREDELAVSTPVPSLGEAFAAILAAEQHEPMPAGWPQTTAVAPVISDETIEQITRQVLDRLSDRVVKEAVSDIVSAVAERLVREEIDRLKASIK